MEGWGDPNAVAHAVISLWKLGAGFVVAALVAWTVYCLCRFGHPWKKK